MGQDSFGLKIGVEGEREFRKSLADINSSFKVLSSEMKLATSQFDSNEKSVESLTAKNAVLDKEIDAQKKKLEVLRSALQNASESFGENDRRTRAWAVALNNAEADLNGMERQVKDNKQQIEQLTGGMSEAEKEADELGDEVKDAGGKAGDAGGKFEGLGSVCKAVAVTMAAAFAAVSAAAVAVGKALVDMTVEGAKYADGVLTESAVTGIATDKLQEYMYAAELVDVSTETLTNSMAKQIKSMKAVQDGTKLSVDAYDKLGVSVMNSDGTLRNSDDVYWEIIDALGKMENETERDALAMQILGKSAQELNPLIKVGAERMNELGAEARKAGYVVSDEMLNAYGKLDDQIQYLTVGTTAAKNALGTVLLPVLTQLAGDGVDLLGEFTNGILDANGDISKMGDVIGAVLPKALDVIMQHLPDILNLITSMLGAVGGAIIDNLPMIVNSASEIILSILQGLTSALPQIAQGALMLIGALVKGILSNLPSIMKTAIQVIITLVQGIAAALPELIPAIVDVVMQICTTLIDNLPLILQAALALILGLAQGILDAIPVLIEALPAIITGIVNFLVEAIPMIIETGIQLLTSLVAALPIIIEAIVAALPLIIDGIITGVLGAIPQLIEAGITLLVSLIQNLPIIITTIVQAIPQIITSIINALIQNIPLIIQAGITLFTSLIKNLPIIIMEIVKAAPQIISGLVSSFGSGVSQMADVGKNLVKGLWDGIQSLATWIWDKVSGWAKGIWDGICKFFGIESPSKKMAWAGKMLVEGMTGGVESNGKETIKAVTDLSSDIEDAVSNLGKEVNVALPTYTLDVNTDTNRVRSSFAKAMSGMEADLRSVNTAYNIGVSGTSGSETPITVSIPLYLDGNMITSATGVIQGNRNISRRRALGVV